MPLSKLNSELKAAERDKYLAETEKAKSEKAKVDHDLEQSKKWLTKNNFWWGLTILSLVITIGLYNYENILKPTLQKENILNELENAEQKKSLKKLADSLSIVVDTLSVKTKKYNRLKNSADSLSALIKTETKNIGQLQSQNHNLQTIQLKTKEQIASDKVQLAKYQRQIEDSKPLVDSLRNASVIGSFFNQPKTYVLISFYIGKDMVAKPEVAYFEGNGFTADNNYKPLKYYPDDIYRSAIRFPLFTGSDYFLKIKSRIYKLRDSVFKITVPIDNTHKTLHFKVPLEPLNDKVHIIKLPW